MNQNEISEYVEYALKIAEYQCETSEEAQDVCQEALLALLLALQRGSAIEHPKAWLFVSHPSKICGFASGKIP